MISIVYAYTPQHKLNYVGVARYTWHNGYVQQNFWDDIYENTPLTDIPWQLTQADWFGELLDEGVLTGETALDLGCGTGIKSIRLA